MSSDQNDDNASPDVCRRPGMLFGSPYLSFDQAEKQQLLKEFQRTGISNNPWLISLFSRYRAVYNCTPTTFLILDEQGHIVDANRAAYTLFSYSKDNLTNLNIENIIHTKDLNSFSLFLRKISNSNEKQSIEVKVKQNNGLFISVMCHGCSHNTEENKKEFFLIIEDISQQKESEKSIYLLNKKLEQKIYDQTHELILKNKKLKEKIADLKKSKQQLNNEKIKLKSIFNAVSEGVLIIKDDGHIESINLSINRIFSYTQDELLGHNITKLIPSRQRILKNNLFHIYLKKNQTEFVGKTWELEGQKKDGSLIPIDISVSKYTLGETQYFTCIIRDISNRKAKELLDKQHLDELAHVTRLGLMGEMASGIAHEVNQPLTAIATYCHVCLRLIKEDSPDLESLYKTLEKTEQQALRAGKIIARMREFVTSNSASRSCADINTLVNHALELASDDCRRFDIAQTIKLADNLPFVNVDSIQIEQVLLNLIKNSIDALIKIPKKTPRKLSIQTYLIDDKTIEVRVKDNGQGISEKAQGKIFTPFFTTKKSGMGMGLSICKSLINFHNGEIRFNYNKDKGTTFYFTLPINQSGK